MPIFILVLLKFYSDQNFEPVLQKTLEHNLPYVLFKSKLVVCFNQG